MVGGELGAADPHALVEHPLGFGEPSCSSTVSATVFSAHGVSRAVANTRRSTARACRARLRGDGHLLRHQQAGEVPIDAPVLG
jgi:hypothetical protein